MEISNRFIISKEVENYIKKLSKQKYAIIIATKGRAENIEDVKNMFPNCLLFVHESEQEDYKDSNLPTVWHKATKGIGSVLNEVFNCMDYYNVKYSAIFDDDLKAFNCFVGNRERKFKNDPEAIEQFIANGCQVLEDLDHPFYQFSSCGTVIKYNQSTPFSAGFSLPYGSSIFRNKDFPRFKVGYQYFEDFDVAMEVFKKWRYHIVENRIGVTGEYRTNDGGCQSFRTEKEMIKAREWIRKKWGRFARWKVNTTGNELPVCAIQRKQI